MDANTPLNVELRTFIEIHFKCTIMNVKFIFRLGFGVKLQAFGVVDCIGTIDRPDFSEENTAAYSEFPWMYRIE